MTKKDTRGMVALSLRGVLAALPQWFGSNAVRDNASRPVMPADSHGNRAAGYPPETWRSFGARVQTFIQWRLAAAGDESRRLCRLMEDDDAPDGIDSVVVASVWINPRGFVDRIDVDGANDQIAVGLSRLLLRQHVGAMPPVGMLQPVRLKLSLGQPN
jgi:hypothetical protein